MQQIRLRQGRDVQRHHADDPHRNLGGESAALLFRLGEIDTATGEGPRVPVVRALGRREARSVPASRRRAEAREAELRLFVLSQYLQCPWGPYIEAFADVLYVPLDAVWFWSIGYPFARPVSPLKAYIHRNQVESDHSYSAYPGASVRDVRSALALRCMLDEFADRALALPDPQFMSEFDRLLIGVQDKLGTFGPFPR